MDSARTATWIVLGLLGLHAHVACDVAQVVGTPAGTLQTPKPALDASLVTWSGTSGSRDVAPRVPLVPQDALASCTPERAWWTEETGPDFIYGSPVLQTSPGQRLLVRRDVLGDTYLRVRDGVPLGHDVRETTGPLDDLWRQRLVAGQGSTVRLVDVRDPSVFRELQELDDVTTRPTGSGPGRIGPPGLALLSSAGLAVARSCWYEGDGVQRATVTAWRLSDGTRLWQTSLVGSCGSATWLEAPLVLEAGPHRLLTAERASEVLTLLDSTDGSVLAEAPIPAPADPQALPAGAWYAERLLALAVNPTRDQAAFTTVDGELHRVGLPDLQPIAPPHPVGVVSVNRMSYGPSIESPVAWSAGGSRMAMLSPAGGAILVDASTLAEVACLASPEPARPAAGSQPDLPENPTTAFHFLPRGDGLVVAHERGVTLWTCAGATPVTGPLGPLTVQLDLPASTLASPEVAAGISVTGASGPVVSTLWRNDAPLAFASTLGERVTTWLEPGQHHVRAVSDDGLTQAVSEPVTVTVLPGP